MNTFERVNQASLRLYLSLGFADLLLPLIALIALLIKWEDSKGDVIYRQERIGYKGKPLHAV